MSSSSDSVPDLLQFRRCYQNLFYIHQKCKVFTTASSFSILLVLDWFNECQQTLSFLIRTLNYYYFLIVIFFCNSSQVLNYWLLWTSWLWVTLRLFCPSTCVCLAQSRLCFAGVPLCSFTFQPLFRPTRKSVYTPDCQPATGQVWTATSTPSKNKVIMYPCTHTDATL